MEYLTETCLYESPLVRIRDVGCTCPLGHAGVMERSSANQVVVTRRGLFLRESAGFLAVGNPNHALFLRRDQEYRMLHPVGGGDDCTAFAVDDATWDEFLRVTAGAARSTAHLENGPVTMTAATQLAALRLYSLLVAELRQSFEVDSAALGLLASIGRPDAVCPRLGDGARQRRARRIIVRTLSYLADCVDEPPLLADVAAAVHCSPFHLTTLFRRLTGIPLHRYHLQWRLALALERLMRQETSLQSVALDFGFSSASHFSSSVRVAFGVPPVELARQLRRIPTGQLRKDLKAWIP